MQKHIEKLMKASQRYLIEQVSEILRDRGGVSLSSPDDWNQDFPEGMMRCGSEELKIEYKEFRFYRQSDFCPAIGDAILRFQHERKKGRHSSDRLFLAFLLQRRGRKAVENLIRYSAEYLPNLDWLVLSHDGFAMLRLNGRDEEMQVPPFKDDHIEMRDVNRGSLFTPKHQWLFKLLLLPGLDAGYWGGPASVPSSINALAMKSGVSQSVVSSFISRAEREGFIKRSGNGFHVQRHRELIEDWGYALKHGRSREIGVQSLYGDNSEATLLNKIQTYVKNHPGRASLVLGGHLACHLLSLGRSNVRSAHLYVNGSMAMILQELDLVVHESDAPPLRLISVPGDEAIFNCSVNADGVPVSDVLQCYFDVRFSYARGLEQADYIYERVLAPHFVRRF